MIQISESAQAHFRKLLAREDIPGLGVKLAATDPGTARADVRLEFAERADLQGDEWAIDCEGFTLWLDAASAPFLDGAQIDYESRATGGQLQIRAPKIKGEAPADSASLVERVRWVVEHEINPQLASHRGHVAVQEVTRDGVVVLRFGVGCHG
ncbi:MAG TPA: iron-sulfur cluster biosynthesis family protein, partial [Xanthomonadaceae bacterium]|nr:iron-sulfur cluster biosynthesis family protein [Xanthomonadaceae bacterium]